MKSKYFINEKYEKLRTLKEIKKFNMGIKDSFLSEELFNIIIKEIDDEIQKISKEIREME